MLYEEQLFQLLIFLWRFVLRQTVAREIRLVRAQAMREEVTPETAWILAHSLTVALRFHHLF